jgi:large subunit ribosomal protein L46
MIHSQSTILDRATRNNLSEEAARVSTTPRSFAADAATNEKKAAAPSAAEGYWEKKKAAKERRRILWEAAQERKERLKTRRKGRPEVGQKRRDFRSFFIKKKVDEEHMNRKARQAGLDWQVKVAVILERCYVVLPDKEDWEIEYENMKTFLGQFGKEYPKELFDIDYDKPRPITDEELLAMLPKGFTPAPRETEADKTGNVRTTNRKLKTSVYLTVQEDEEWQLPTVTLLDDGKETFLEAAKRAVKEKVGDGVEFWCPSNCPWSVDMKAFPENQRANGLYGTKTFFMKVQYDEGVVSEQEMTVQDFAWLDRREIAERFGEKQGDEASMFYHYML